MRKIWSLLPFLFVLLFGCTYIGQDIQPSERALVFSQQYQSLENTYKSQYTFADEEEKEWLSEEVAPVLDRARSLLIQHNQFVLEGETGQAIDRRLELIRLLRQVSNMLLQE